MKQTDADRLGQLSKDAQHSLSVAGDALVEALDHMKFVVGDDGNDIEQSTEAPWPLVSFRSSRRWRQDRASVLGFGGRALVVDVTILCGSAADMFVVADGVRIARRGYPDTSQAGTWVSLEPGWEVVDDGRRNTIAIKHNGVSVRFKDFWRWDRVQVRQRHLCLRVRLR
jgi:hypothetical protein